MSHPRSPTSTHKDEVKLNSVLEKMKQMKKSFTLPFQNYGLDKYLLWLSVGPGKAYESEIYRFSNALKLLLDIEMTEDYKEAIMGESPRKSYDYNWKAPRGLQDDATGLMSAFLSKYPLLLDFFYSELCEGISQLELADRALSKFLDDILHPAKLLINPQPERPLRPASTSRNYPKQQWGLFKESKSITEKSLDKTWVVLKPPGSVEPALTLSDAEYKTAFYSLNRFANERAQSPQPLLTLQQLTEAAKLVNVKINLVADDEVSVNISRITPACR